MKNIREKFNNYVKEKGNALGEKFLSGTKIGDYLTTDVDVKKPIAYGLAAGTLFTACNTTPKRETHQLVDNIYDSQVYQEGEKLKADIRANTTKTYGEIDRNTSKKVKGLSDSAKKVKDIEDLVAETDKNIENTENTIKDNSENLSDEFEGYINDVNDQMKKTSVYELTNEYSTKQKDLKENNKNEWGLNFSIGRLFQDHSGGYFDPDRLLNIIGEENKSLHKKDASPATYLQIDLEKGLSKRAGIGAFARIFPENAYSERGQTDSGSNYKYDITSNMSSVGIGPFYKIYDGDVFDLTAKGYLTSTKENIDGDITFLDSGAEYNINDSGNFLGIEADAEMSWKINEALSLSTTLGYQYTRLISRDDQNTEATFNGAIGIKGKF